MSNQGGYERSEPYLLYWENVRKAEEHKLVKTALFLIFSIGFVAGFSFDQFLRWLIL